MSKGYAWGLANINKFKNGRAIDIKSFFMKAWSIGGNAFAHGALHVIYKVI